MDDRDKIRALWLNAEMIFNALEELEEDPHTVNGEALVQGTTGELRWNIGLGRWEAILS